MVDESNTAESASFIEKSSHAFPPASVESSVDTIGRIYEKAGVPEQFRKLTYPDGHQFDVETQGEAFARLDRNFGHSPKKR